MSETAVAKTDPQPQTLIWLEIGTAITSQPMHCGFDND
jgi:hypothetical protein